MCAVRAVLQPEPGVDETAAAMARYERAFGADVIVSEA